MKIWRIMLMTLAAFFLASYSSDDNEETVSGSDAQRALFEMKNNYSGELRYGLKDKSDRQTLHLRHRDHKSVDSLPVHRLPT